MIELSNVTKIYNHDKSNECKAIDDISLRINKGEMIAIMGKSGSGKSTLLHIIAGIDKPTYGSVNINGVIINELKESYLSNFRIDNIGIILQDFFLINECNVLDNVMVPLNFKNMKNKVRIERATKLIYQVDLEKYLKKPVIQLSGGEKQRVAIARALVNEPKIILADEPTGSLDQSNAQNILNLLIRINKKMQKTVIIVTHDQEIADLCDRIITISEGNVQSDINIFKEKRQIKQKD